MAYTALSKKIPSPDRGGHTCPESSGLCLSFTALTAVAEMARIASDITVPGSMVLCNTTLKLLLSRDIYFSTSWTWVGLVTSLSKETQRKGCCVCSARHREAWRASASILGHCPATRMAACWRMRAHLEQRCAIAVETVKDQEAPSKRSSGHLTHAWAQKYSPCQLAQIADS